MASRMTGAHTTIERAGFGPRRGGEHGGVIATVKDTRASETQVRLVAAWERRNARLAPFAMPEVIYGTPPRPTWSTPPSGETTAKGDPDAPAPQAPQPLVLVVEDEESIAETLAMIVEEVGYTPIIARNGREGLLLARSYQPRLIITDLMMPYLTGAEFIAAARVDADTAGYPFPPVIVITAASRMRAEQAGADVVITKPFDVTKVEAAIRRLIEGEPS